MVKGSKIEGYDFSSLAVANIEFVKCTGKRCRVLQTMSDFEWTPGAVKSIAGQGDLYVRLCSDFSTLISESTEVEESLALPTEPLPTEPSPPSPETENLDLLSTPFRSSPSTTPPVTTQPIDLTHETASGTIPSSNDEVDFSVFKTTQILPRERLFEIFPNMSVNAVDTVLGQCGSDSMHTCSSMAHKLRICYS